MTDYAYTEILNLFEQLTPEEQVKLLKELESRINGQGKQHKPRSIMEYEGFAEELWRGVDVDKYIEEERSSWGG